MPQRMRNELAANLLLTEERKPLLKTKKLLKGAIYGDLDSDLSVSDVSWSDNDRHLFMHGAFTTNHTMKIKSKFRTRAQKKYDKLVDRRKLQSENISDKIYNGKNHVKFFAQLELNMHHNKDLKYFKINNAKLRRKVSLLTEAHTLTEEDVKSHLNNCYVRNDIRVKRVY